MWPWRQYLPLWENKSPALPRATGMMSLLVYDGGPWRASFQCARIHQSAKYRHRNQQRRRLTHVGRHQRPLLHENLAPGGTPTAFFIAPLSPVVKGTLSVYLADGWLTRDRKADWAPVNWQEELKLWTLSALTASEAHAPACGREAPAHSGAHSRKYLFLGVLLFSEELQTVSSLSLQSDNCFLAFRLYFALSERPGFKSQFWQLLAVWPPASYRTSF